MEPVHPPLSTIMLTPLALALLGVPLPQAGAPAWTPRAAEPGPEVAEPSPVARPVAGPDQELAFGELALLEGRIENRSPLDFWVADGNDDYENKLVRFQDGAVTAVGPMRRTTGQVMGWTGDLVRIEDRVYGIDVGARAVFVADLEGGICLPVTPPLSGSYRGLQSLAYDAEGRKLYAIDQVSGTLLEVERGSGATHAIHVPGLDGRRGMRSLAFEPELGLLFTVDSDQDVLLVVDPGSGLLVDTMPLPADPRGQIEELCFFEGRLYAMLGLLDAQGQLNRGQLQHIDLQSGFVGSIGEPVEHVSPHALLVNSVPEEHYWAQVAGPAVAELEYTTLLETRARFPEPGRYEFALTVLTREGPVSDRVAISVQAPQE